MKNILVVDDNKDIADMLRLTLELSGYNSTATYSGKDCLDLLLKDTFDLLLLDIAMPGITGIDILQKIKTEPTLSKTKIVFITASSPTDDVIETLLKQGALEVIKKPITEKILLKTIAKYV